MSMTSGGRPKERKTMSNREDKTKVRILYYLYTSYIECINAIYTNICHCFHNLERKKDTLHKKQKQKHTSLDMGSVA